VSSNKEEKKQVQFIPGKKGLEWTKGAKRRKEEQEKKRGKGCARVEHGVHDSIANSLRKKMGMANYRITRKERGRKDSLKHKGGMRYRLVGKMGRKKYLLQIETKKGGFSARLAKYYSDSPARRRAHTKRTHIRTAKQRERGAPLVGKGKKRRGHLLGRRPGSL